MRTLRYGNLYLRYGDPSGDVVLAVADPPLSGGRARVERIEDPYWPRVEVTLPFAALLKLVAGQVRRDRVAALERASDAEILGVPDGKFGS